MGMNVDQRIDRAKKDKRLADLLKKTDRDIFETNELVDMLVGYVAQMQSTLIDQNARIVRLGEIVVEQDKAIESIANMVSPSGNPFQPLAPAPERPRIVGCDQPKIIGIPKGEAN